VIALAAAAAATAGDAQVSWTLRVLDNGKVVRTVAFSEHVPLTAGNLAVYRRKSAYWEVSFLGKDAGGRYTPTLCSAVCADYERGREATAPFANLIAVTTTHDEYLVSGSVPIGAKGSIVTVSLDRWISPTESRGGLMIDTPKPIPVKPGQKLSFAIVLKVPPAHG